MAQTVVTGAKPELIKWARETIGLSIDDVARRLKRPVAQIYDWESGKTSPSYSQLEKYAYSVCKRPLAVFFLPFPPKEVAHKKEFRTLPDFDLETMHPNTHLHIRKAHAYLLALKDIFNNRNTASKRIWDSIKLIESQSVLEQSIIIREFLGITLDEQSSWKVDSVALKKWRQAIEEVGIFVFKDSFKEKKIAGFCLHDKEFPVIYLNNSTTKTKQIFSLLHELTHILLGINGISKFNEQFLPIEQYCNKLAAEILIPNDDFNAKTKTILRQEVTDQVCASLASYYGVSREAILRRFLERQKVSKAYYEEKSKFWTDQMKSNELGGNWYASRNVYLSERFAKEVIGRHYRNEMTISQASELLGVKTKNFFNLEHCILKGMVD